MIPRIARYALLGAALASVGSLACREKTPTPGSGADVDSFPLLCKACGHYFTIPRDELRSYPSGAAGEGLKCAKCGKFAARSATRCPKCNSWYISESRGMPCPHCQKGDTATPAPR